MRKAIIAILLLATGIFGFITRCLDISADENTHLNWVHIVVVVVPIVCLLIAYSEDYNQRTMGMFWSGIVFSVLTIPIASLFVKIFSLSGNKIAWTLAEGIDYLIVAVIIIIDRKVELNHRRQYGLGEFRKHEPA